MRMEPAQSAKNSNDPVECGHSLLDYVIIPIHHPARTRPFTVADLH